MDEDRRLPGSEEAQETAAEPLREPSGTGHEPDDGNPAQAASDTPGGTGAVPPQEPAAARPPVDVRDSGASPLRQFMGLFVVPLLVVLACVGVFVGFGYIAYERKGAGEYLDDLRSGWGPRRRQAAYELSRILMTDAQALAEEPGGAADVRSLFRDAEDETVRQYLALVLGYTGDREAVPVLVEALEDADSQTQIYSAIALGNIADPAAREPLSELLDHDDPGLRKTAAHALGSLGDPAAVPDLEPLLADSTADVRWNAALSLARLGSDAGVEELERMVDRRLLAQVPEITPAQQEEVMVSAVPALAAVAGERARPILERLAEDDPSLKVRQVALEAREALREGSGS